MDIKSFKVEARKLIERFNKLGKRQRLLVLLLIGSIIFSLYYNIVYKPQKGNLRRSKAAYSSLNNRIEKLKLQMPDIEREKAGLARARKSYEELRAELARLEAQLPSQARVPQLLGELVRQAQGLGIDFVSIKPKPTKEKAEYARLDIEMKFIAKYTGLVNYLHRLEKIAQFLNTTSVAMEETRDGLREESQMTLNLTTLLAEKGAEVAEFREAPLPQPISVERSPFVSEFRPGLKTEEKERYRLSGIISRSGQSTAIINDEVYRLGDMVDNMKVIEILPNKVILSDGRETIILTIE